MTKAISDYYGWRARLGIIYTSSSTIMESDFYAMAPAGVSSHTTRVMLGKVTVDELSKLGGRAVEATRLLATAHLDSIVFGCTSGSFVNGPGYDAELIEELSEVSEGIPVTTTTAAMVLGLETLGLEKVVIVTPYTDEINARAQAYFDAIGHPVLAIKGLGVKTDYEMTRLAPETVYRLARSAWTKEADGMVISCTSLRTLEVIDELENDLGKPVISSNQASFWASLRTAGVEERVPGFGTLLLT
ncbi:MAG: aspartate/glutamate racemase family protein [Anaerolineales bacterium]|nr:aspartate/glutamate racemase family protein [Anaerolineales bacterium]